MYPCMALATADVNWTHRSRHGAYSSGLQRYSDTGSQKEAFGAEASGREARPVLPFAEARGSTDSEARRRGSSPMRKQGGANGAEAPHCGTTRKHGARKRAAAEANARGAERKHCFAARKRKQLLDLWGSTRSGSMRKHAHAARSGSIVLPCAEARPLRKQAEAVLPSESQKSLYIHSNASF